MSKAETQALTNYGSGEDENEDEEIEEFEEGPVDVQTSLQANTEATEEMEHDDQVFQSRQTHLPPVVFNYWRQILFKDVRIYCFPILIFMNKQIFLTSLQKSQSNTSLFLHLGMLILKAL